MNRIYLPSLILVVIILTSCDRKNREYISFKKDNNDLLFFNKYNKIIYSLENGTYSIINCSDHDTLVKNGKVRLNNTLETPDLKIVKHDYEEWVDSLGKGNKLTVMFSNDNISINHYFVLYQNYEHIVTAADVINCADIDYRINSFSVFYANVFLLENSNAKHFFLDGNSGKIPTKVREKDSLYCLNNILITEKLDDNLTSFVTGGYQYKDFDRFIQVKKENDSYSVNVYNKDPVGKLIPAGGSYTSGDRVYINFHDTNPIHALERYAEIFKMANLVKLQQYIFPTVCLWYNDFYGDTSMGNHSLGAALEAEQAKKSGFLNYSPFAVRLVPDMYALKNQQGWWDDEHWQRKNIFEHRGRAIESGHYRNPYLTTAEWAKKVTEFGGIPLTYIQPGMRSDDYAETFPGHMLFNQPHAPRLDKNGDTIYYSKTHWQDHLRGVMKRHSYDYTDSGFITHLHHVYANLKEAGIRGLMYDFPDMARAENGGMDDSTSTTAAAYRKIFEIAREDLGPEAYLHERNIKKGSDITLGLVSSHRIMGDNDKINPTLTRRGGLRWYKNRVLVNYDMDAKNLYIVSPDNRDGQRAMLTMTYVTSGRFLMANSFASLQKDSALFYDFTRIFPFHKAHRSARPVDAFTGKITPEIFDFVVDSTWHQVTFYNAALNSGKWPEWGQTFHLPENGKQVSSNMSVDMSGQPGFGALGLNAEAAYYVYDFWNNHFVGIINGNEKLTQTLRPGEARMLSVHKVLGRPQFISTNSHLMQGFVDMVNYPRWDDTKQTLSGVSRIVSNDPYSIIIAKNGFDVIAEKENQSDVLVEYTELENDLLMITITSNKSIDYEWSIEFIERNNRYVSGYLFDPL